jgi:two-component system, NarL family, sensor kinase
MKPFVYRIICFIILINSLMSTHYADAQAPDSLRQAIDEILKSHNVIPEAQSSNLNRNPDTLSYYLSEADRYGRINSDTSLLFIRKAVNLAYQLESQELISHSLQKLGDYYMSREMYREAMAYYLTSLTIEENRNDERRTADLYDALGVVYYYMEVFDKSLDYHGKALDIYTAQHDTLGIAETLSHLGTLYSSREYCEKRSEEEKLIDYQTAINYYEQSMQFSTLAGDEQGIAKDNQNIAAVYNKMKKPEIALGYIQKSIDYFRKANDPEGIIGALFTLGRTYYRLKEYEKSIAAYRESEKMAIERNLTGGIQYLYESLAMPYYDTKDYKSAYDCYIKYMTIRDSVYNAEKSKQIIELETKYQSELKQKEIMRLKAEQKRKNTLTYSLFAVIAMLGLAIYFYVRFVRKKKIIVEQELLIRENKIRELEQEKVYLAARSVMEGEEAERSRLASDLHNGLGGLLSGIKINLSSMKENAVITHENVSAFNHALSLLDTSISELRRIAHNLMPETLNHYGLKTALEDFCTQVSPTGKPEISLQFFGDEIRYTKEMELTIYRVIQELVNNALKHSEASRINVQLFSEPKRVSAQVTDNGKGFDSSRTEKEKLWKGLENIRDRITAMNGRFDIWSSPGQGTEASVEIEIQ